MTMLSIVLSSKLSSNLFLMFVDLSLSHEVPEIAFSDTAHLCLLLSKFLVYHTCSYNFMIKLGGKS